MSRLEIIAECAQGYEGDPKLAQQLCLGSLNSGADWIKFQLVYADELCVSSYPYYSFFKSLEMSVNDWQKLVELVHRKNKKFIFDIYGAKSLKIAKTLNVDAVKISTTDFFNQELIVDASKEFSDIFLSVGGVTIQEIENCLSKIQTSCKVSLLYGFQSEPTPLEENRLFQITKLVKAFPSLQIGFMDHSDGRTTDAFDLSKVAIGCGASIVEKHITLAHGLELEDNVSALNIDEFKEFSSILRRLYTCLGSSADEVQPSASMISYLQKAGKISVAAHSMKKGHILTKDCIELKRVFTEPNPKAIYDKFLLVGKKLSVDVTKDTPIFGEKLE